MAPLFLTLAFLFSAGLAAATVPIRVQTLILEFLRKTGTYRFNPFFKWMQTDSYVTYLRLMGWAMMAFVALILYVARNGPIK